MSDCKQFQTVYLEPFIHQVGGHSQMFSLDSCTVCKPLIPRELSFYQSMPCQIKPFAPAFRGVVKAKVVEESDGFVAVVALVPNSYLTLTGQQITDCPVDGTRRKVRLHRSGRIEMSEDHRTPALFEEADATTGDLGCPARHRLGPYNPGLFRCSSACRGNDSDSNVTATVKFKSSPSLSVTSSSAPQHLSLLGVPTEYLLLENLTCNYKRPCVLDLKMGTRQYADDDTVAKQKRKKAKAASSTSASLGARINGMQVYEPSLDRYMCRSKYYGRQLTVEGFKDSLRVFFSGMSCLYRRVLVVQQLLHRLNQLHDALQQLSSYRFFTSSLLLLYDAFVEGSEACSRHHCCCDQTAVKDVAIVDCEMDERGLGADSVEGSTRQSSATRVSRSPLLSQCRSSSLHRFNNGSNNNNNNHSKNSDNRSDKCENSNKNNNGRSAGVLVDVRIIDFAHATHELLGTETSVRHVGPDTGFIFGLCTLIDELRLVLAELSTFSNE